MSDQTPQPYAWTTKGPALIAGLVLIAGGFLFMHGRWRWSIPLGLAAGIVGVMLVLYSTRVQGWCAPANAAAFGKEWGPSFWHGPSAWDCWHLVNPLTPKGR
jgi:hypothetical protein